MRRIAVVVTALAVLVASCTGGPGRPATARTPLQVWLSHPPLYIAHRGGDADWPEGTAYAYRQAAAWNPRLALEVPVRRTSDGVWVVSEDATTGRVFGSNYRIAATPWATLKHLRTRDDSQPMARLVHDVLDVYGRKRILFVDDKADKHAADFLNVLGAYGGPKRFVVKCHWMATNVPALARRRGYVTWGFYYAKDMADFAATQDKFGMLGLDYTAPAADFAPMLATGKPVIAHIIPTETAAKTAFTAGARGVMVSGVREVVPRG